MHPVVGLILFHAKHVCLNFLDGIDIQIEQDKQKPISICAQEGLATASGTALAFFRYIVIDARSQQKLLAMSQVQSASAR